MSREVAPSIGPDGRPWLPRSEITKLAAAYVVVVELDRLEEPAIPSWGYEHVWCVSCALCGHVGPGDDEQLIAGYGDGEGGNYAYWDKAWSYADKHVVAEHRDEFPEHRLMPVDLYGWWLMRSAAEREDMERRHAAEREELRRFHDQALQMYMGPRGRR